MSLHVAATQKFVKIERFVRDAVNMCRAGDKMIGSHHCTIQPVNDAAASDAANHADIWSIDLRYNVADKVLWQARCIRHFRRSFYSTHCAIPRLPHCAGEPSCTRQGRARKQIPYHRLVAGVLRGVVPNQGTDLHAKRHTPHTTVGGALS